MEVPLQDGIYYDRTRRAGHSLCITLLKITSGSTAREVSNALSEIWLLYRNLRDGKTGELDQEEKGYPSVQKESQSGNLTMLIGYTADIFSLKNVRNIPEEFKVDNRFNNPLPEGGGCILDGSRVKYSLGIRTNPAAFDHVMLQFIGDSEFVTSHAVAETWKILSTLRNSRNEHVMFISEIYTGFQRNDNRSWLGFHDGVSNLPTEERLEAIAININQLESADNWIANGTYLGFMRIEINLDDWKKETRESQEMIIGRDKITGCPIINIDNQGNPIKDSRCPIVGNSIIERGNETIRGTYSAFPQRYLSSHNPFPSKLNFSHVARARVLNNTKDGNASPYRIFRQGYEYFEPADHFPGFTVGLNFVSFQNKPSTLFSILKEGFSQNNIETSFKPLEDYFSVRAAGIFLVPPLSSKESFPGDTIFNYQTESQDEFLTDRRRYRLSDNAK